jgi:Fe-S cluster assembly scaffold protein SufB
MHLKECIIFKSFIGGINKNIDIQQVSVIEPLMYHMPSHEISRTKFIVEDYAVSTIIILYDNEGLQEIEHAFEFLIGSYAHIKIFFGFLQGKNLQISCDIKMQGVQSKAEIYALYALNQTQSLSFSTQQLHLMPHTSSVLLIKGALTDTAQCKYKGLIYVDEQARNTYADQQHQNLMLSQKSNLQTDPHIQVHTNEVMCSHGAASSGFDDEQLYSLQARGISESKAKELLFEAFLQEALVCIPQEHKFIHCINTKVML